MLSEAAVTGEEFVQWMKIITKRSLHQMGPAPPTMAHMKEGPAFPPRVHVKHEPASPLRQVNDEPTSSLRNSNLHIGSSVKQELASLAPPRRDTEAGIVLAAQRNRYAWIHGPSPSPRRHRPQIKEAVPPAIAKARGHILHYPRGEGFGDPSGSWAMVSEAERMTRQEKRYDWHNDGLRSAFAKTDVRQNESAVTQTSPWRGRLTYHHHGDDRQASPTP